MEWKEGKQAFFGSVENSSKMLVYEPCNYASNVAFYHSCTQICDLRNWSSGYQLKDDLKTSFATLALGSHFWHESHTYSGKSFDNRMIGVISYLIHESMV